MEGRCIRRDDDIDGLASQKRDARLSSEVDGDGMIWISERFDPATGHNVLCRGPFGLSAWSLRALLREDPDVAMHVIQVLTSRLRAANEAAHD